MAAFVIVHAGRLQENSFNISNFLTIRVLPLPP